MESFKLSIKFFAADGVSLDAARIVPVFHRWIQSQAQAPLLPEHLLIDVADYAHVVDGPGVVLVSHEANISADSTEGRLGLLYMRKQPFVRTPAGTFAERLRQTLRYALHACRLLEEQSEGGAGWRFRTDNPLFAVHDRLLAPNDAKTFAEVQPELTAVFSDLYDASVRVDYRADPARLFRAQITAPASPDLATLLRRLEPIAAQ
jgi:hypothetical protein